MTEALYYDEKSGCFLSGEADETGLEAYSTNMVPTPWNGR